VWICPIPANADPLRLLSLEIDVSAGMGIARLAYGGGVGICLAGIAHVLRHLEFYRKSMTIPTRHVRRAEPTQTLVFNYDVFENLVQSRADVDVAVGEGRAIVQHKLLRARALGLDALIESAP